MKKNFDLTIISKYRNAIYGFSIAWITLFHAHAVNKVDFSFGNESLGLFATIIQNGSVGVDCFLFLSGICQYFSFYRNPNTVQYLRKRLSRLWIPVLVINLWYWLMLYSKERDIGDLIARIFLVRFWQQGDQSIWFVSLILILYLIYPFVYRIIYINDKGSGIAVRTATLMMLSYIAIFMAASLAPEAFKMTEIATTRIPVYLLGCGLGKLIYDGKEIGGRWKAVPIILFAAFIGEVHVNLIQSYPKRLFFLIGGVTLAYTLAIFFDRISAHGKKKSIILGIFSKLGEFSLEIYLSAGIWDQILRKWRFYEDGNLLIYLGMLFLAYLFAYKAHRIVKRITTKLEER